MPQRIQLPDGSIAEFPDGMGDAEIEAVLRREFAPNPGTSVPERGMFEPPPGVSLGESYKRGAVGLLKSGYNTFAGATQALAPLMERLGLGGQFPPLRSVPYENSGEQTAGQVGNVAQFFLPGKAGQAVAGRGLGGLMRQATVEGLSSAGLSKAQGDNNQTAAVAGAVGFGVPVAGRVLGRVLAPFRRAVNQPVADTAANLGVEMPASALSTAKPVPIIESLASKGLFGRQAAQRVERAAEQLTKMADETARAAGNADPSAAGRAVSDGLSRFRRQFVQTKGQLYEQAVLPNKGLLVEARETVDLLDSIIASKESASKVLGRAGGHGGDEVDFFRRIRDGLTKKVGQTQPPAPYHGASLPPKTGGQTVVRQVEAKDLLSARRALNQRISNFNDPLATGNRGILKKLAATMDGELDAAISAQAPDLAARLEQANRYYAEGITKINSAFGKSIHRLSKAGQYDKIAQSVANSRMSADDIPRVLEVAGAEGTDGLRAVVLSDLIGKAKGLGGRLTPEGLSRGMKAFGEDRLEALLTPEQFQKLKGLAQLSASLKAGQKVTEGSQTAFISRLAYPAAALASPMGFLKLFLGDAAMSKFIASSYGQRWLTNGYRVPASWSVLARPAAQGVRASAGRGQ